MKGNEVLHHAVHRAISGEYYYRVAAKISDTSDGHINALTDAVVAQLQRLVDDGRVTVRGTPGL